MILISKAWYWLSETPAIDPLGFSDPYSLPRRHRCLLLPDIDFHELHFDVFNRPEIFCLVKKLWSIWSNLLLLMQEMHDLQVWVLKVLTSDSSLITATLWQQTPKNLPLVLFHSRGCCCELLLYKCMRFQWQQSGLSIKRGTMNFITFIGEPGMCRCTVLTAKNVDLKNWNHNTRRVKLLWC